MRGLSSLTVMCVLFAAIPSAWAQRAAKGRGSFPNSSDASGLVNRMMRFDTDQDGKLTRNEVTDNRSLLIFDSADADEDGTVTKAELSSFAAKERSNARGGNRAGRGRFGDGFPAGGPGMGPGGPPPKPGVVLPPMIQNHLQLTSQQKSQIQDLQKEVDAKLARILTEQQKAQLEEMQRHGPPGGGPPPGGFGDGGPPPPPDF